MYSLIKSKKRKQGTLEKMKRRKGKQNKFDT